MSKILPELVCLVAKFLGFSLGRGGPLGGAAHLAGDALLDTAEEVVAWVSAARIIGKVQLLHLGQQQVVVMVTSRVKKKAFMLKIFSGLLVIES